MTVIALAAARVDALRAHQLMRIQQIEEVLKEKRHLKDDVIARLRQFRAEYIRLLHPSKKTAAKKERKAELSETVNSTAELEQKKRQTKQIRKQQKAQLRHGSREKFHRC